VQGNRRGRNVPVSNANPRDAHLERGVGAVCQTVAVNRAVRRSTGSLRPRSRAAGRTWHSAPPP
jgi:hypothetical protein